MYQQMSEDYDYYDQYYDSVNCHTVGINGGCGYDCPVFQRGICDIQDEIIEQGIKDGMKEEFIEMGLIEEDLPTLANDAFDRAMEFLDK